MDWSADFIYVHTCWGHEERDSGVLRTRRKEGVVPSKCVCVGDKRKRVAPVRVSDCVRLKEVPLSF